MSKMFLSRHYVLCLVVIGAMMPVLSRAQIEFFPTPLEQKRSITKESRPVARGTKSAKILFFIAPGCSACPDEAAKLAGELNRLGLKYQIEGVFVGDPPQIGKYLAGLRTYPFKFDIALDMDGKMTRQYGVKAFPSVVIEIDGKKLTITKATDLEAKLK
jgi:hypothetical protein